MFGRIKVDPENHAGQPYFDNTEILVTEVIEMLAMSEKASVYKKYPALEKKDVADALLYAAHTIHEKVLVSLYENEDDDLAENPIIDLALEYPSVEVDQVLLDVEAGNPLLQITRFQLEYLKQHMSIPPNEMYGWYFTQVALTTLKDDILALQKVASETVADADSLEEELEQGEGIDPQEIDELDEEADILEIKLNELIALKESLEKAMGDYDAFEISWKPLEEGNRAENNVTG